MASIPLLKPAETAVAPGLVDIIEFDEVPIQRSVTIAEGDETLDRLAIGQEESSGNTPGSNSTGGPHRLSKYIYSHVRLGGNTTYRNAQNQDADVNPGVYCPDAETQFGGSPFAQNGSGGHYSHEQHYKWISDTSVGGNPHGGRMGSDNGGAVDDDWGLFIGHTAVSIPFKTTNSVTKLTGSGDTVQFFGTGGTDQFQIGETSWVYTPHTPATEWLAESLTATPYTDAEGMVLVSKTSTSLTFKQLRFPNGNLFGSMGNRGSLDHPSGSRIVQVLPGQASIVRLNFRFNVTDKCPRDAAGRTWNEFNVMWTCNNYQVDSSGNNTGIIKTYKASDVNDTYLATKYKPDLDGDGVQDNGYYGNENAYTNGFAAQAALYKTFIRDKPPGSTLPTETTPIFGNFRNQHGGVKEEPLPEYDAQQTESMADGQAQHAGDATKFNFCAPMADRFFKGAKSWSTSPKWSSIVTKAYTNWQHPSNDVQTKNDLTYFQLAMTAMGGGTLCIRDTSNYGARPLNYDPWPEVAAVIADPNNLQGQVLGQAIENTDTNQALIKANRRWPGKPVGPIYNISGVDILDAGSFTPIYDRNYTTITNTDSWSSGGNNKGTSSLIHNASTNAIRLQNIKGGASWGGLNMYSESIFDNSHRGKEFIIYLKYASSSRALFQVQAGENNDHELQVYPDPGYSNHLMICGKFSGSEDFSGQASSIKLEVSRLVGKNIANNWLDIEGIKCWVGDNLHNTAHGQYCERAWMGYNATPRTITVPLRGAFIKPIVSSIHAATHTTGGQTITTVSIPPNSAALLVRAANNYDYISTNYDRQNNKVYVKVPAGEGAAYASSYLDLWNLPQTPILTLNQPA